MSKAYKWGRWVLVCLAVGACDFIGGDGPDGGGRAPGERGAPKAGARAGDVSASSEVPPIAVVGHGAFFDAEGKQVEPDEARIGATQRRHVERLEAMDGFKNAGVRRDLIDKLVENKIVARALYIDALLAALKPRDEAHIASVNHATRWHYLLKVLKLAAPSPGKPWAKGVDPKHVDELERNGVPVRLSINSGGEKYREACKAAGVPVPDAMYSKEWVNRGTFDNEFISEGLEAELWSYESTDPPGVCLALPRYPSSDPSSAELFGIICLGTQSSKACFFDNPEGVKFKRNVEEPLSSWVGGTDLVANGLGVCSDCHAGENPYIVHPEKRPFADVLAATSIKPLSWYEPLVDPSWPQNPGPTSILDAVSSAGRCDGCHRPGSSAGRFPELSQELPGYCFRVLAQAVRPISPGTMPAFGADQSQFTAHITALQNACERPSTSGEIVEVDPPGDQGVVSAPLVIGPLYQCAKQVAVRGARSGATLTVRINGANVASHDASSPTAEVFNVPDLVANDVVTAVQEVGGVPSPESQEEIVRDHTVDYPMGLPAPSIDPALIHECAKTIAVHHVPGAELTVYSNGGSPRKRFTSTDYSVAHPADTPFVVGQEFTAEISLCGAPSPLSAPQRAAAAPASMPAPAFDPPETYAGQQLLALTSLVHGAFTSVSEGGFGPLGEIDSWPVSWYSDFDVATPLGRPLQPGDTVHASQRLCEKGPENQTPPARPCEELPPPRISTPVAGQRYVVVTDSVPGADVFVYDAANKTLGVGSGTVVTLSRDLTASETITVVQQLGKCPGRFGYRVRVVEGRGQ